MLATIGLGILLSVLPGARQVTAEDSATPVFFAISVPDLEASVDWYQRHLDLTVRPLPETPRAKIAILEGNGLMVEILEHREAFDLTSRLPEVRRRYLVHGPFKVGFFVRELDQMVARLKDLGARFRGEVVEDRANGVRTILLLDNNENVIQLFQRIE